MGEVVESFLPIKWLTVLGSTNITAAATSVGSFSAPARGAARRINAFTLKKKVTLELGSNGDVDESGVNVTVPSVSVKWMKNRNRCDATEIRFSEKPKVGLLPGSIQPLHNHTETIAAQQKNLKAFLTFRATENAWCAKT